MRCAGQGMKVLIIQFMKGSLEYGEIISAKKLGITIMQFGRPGFINPTKPTQADFDIARKGLDELHEAVISGDWDMVIADEINVALKFGLLELTDVLQTVAVRNAKTELVFTGRYAAPELIDAADLVTEMKEIKHYFNTEGLDARQGVEF